MKKKGILIAEGDSWFDYGPGYDILTALEALEYDIKEVAAHGDTLREMVFSANDEQFKELERTLIQVAAIDQATPRAILLSGGGNDFTGKEQDRRSPYDYKFERLLNDKNSGDGLLNKGEVDQVMNVELYGLYKHLIAKIDDACGKIFGKVVPILVHGYGYVVPDGRGIQVPQSRTYGFPPSYGPWLKPAFRKKHYYDLQENTDAMRAVIDEFNGMLARLEGGHVMRVDLRNCLSNSLEGGGGLKEYEKDWANELHPTYNYGFIKIAAEFDKVLTELPYN